MKTAVKLSALSALLLALASAAHADTINLGSYGTGDSANGAGNSALVYAGYNSSTPSTALSLSGTGTTYELTNVSPWSGPIAGTSWVSLNAGDTVNGGNTEPFGYYTYTSTFKVAENDVYDGTISVYADDTAEVFLNGTLIVPFDSNLINGPCAQSKNGPTCEGSPWTVSFTANLTAGATNKLTIVDWQSGGSAAGVDFAGSLFAAPEPSSLLLLGTGLLGLALMVFRKARLLRSVLHS